MGVNLGGLFSLNF